jgi:hypothetical protein
MKKSILALAVIAFGISSFTTSCKKKEECHECHYDDDNNNKVEMGIKCGEELEKLERDGFMVNNKKHEVHCHDDH